MKVHYENNIDTQRISISEFRSDYYDSDIYRLNMANTVQNAIKYSVIKAQLETDGKYNPDKVIYIGQYANRFNSTEYTGVDAGYYLKDLIAWGQYGISQNGISHSYKTFDSFEAMNDFFGKEGNTEETYYVLDEDLAVSEVEEFASESENPSGDMLTFAIESSSVYDSSIPMLDIIENKYVSVDGQNLEYYAYNEEDYNILSSNLISAAIDLYTNYRTYTELSEFFNPDYTNIRFYINDGNNNIYTNLINSYILDETKLSESFRSMGEYLYCMPSKIDYLTNTPLIYDFVKEEMLNYYYALGDDAFLWIGLDTSYPVMDVFAENYYSIKRTIHLIPWVISLATVGLFGFIGLFVILVIAERKRMNVENPAIQLRLADRLPFEAEIILYLLFFAIVNVAEIFVFKDKTIYSVVHLRTILFPTCIVTFMYSLLFLLFLYTVVRRILAHRLYNGSYFYKLNQWIGKRFSFVGKFGVRIYNSSGMALRTWAEYIIFLLFNTFWACMLFFSSIPVIAFLVLLAFDSMTGVILFNRNWEKKKIIDAIRQINEGNYDIKLELSRYHGGNRELASTVNEIGRSISQAVATSSKDEKLKADLITNVSHDIKTPLTSIINYVDLIKRENIDNERVQNYVRVLDEKSQRLKQLTMDLVEASKITSGNVKLEFTRINLCELLNQAKGEFEEKYESRNLSVVDNIPSESIMMDADPRYLWRIVENLLQNIYKYAMEGTRVYLDVSVNEDRGTVSMLFKNISNQQLNIEASELTERFIRGDLARSSEGSGLGLSIVKSLCKAHNGSFDVYLDGDLFKATVILPLVNNDTEEKMSAE